MTNREGGCGSSSRINRGKNHGRWCWKRCRSSWVKTYTALKTIEVILILLWDGKSWEHCSIHFNRIIAVALMRIDLKEDGAEADHWGGCCSYTDGGGGLDWWFRSRCIWKAALIAFTDRLDMEYEKNTTGSLTVCLRRMTLGWDGNWDGKRCGRSTFERCIRSLVLDILTLRGPSVLSRQLDIGVKAKGVRWARDTNLGVISVQIIFKTAILKEITEEWIRVSEWS